MRAKGYVCKVNEIYVQKSYVEIYCTKFPPDVNVYNRLSSKVKILLRMSKTEHFVKKVRFRKDGSGN